MTPEYSQTSLFGELFYNLHVLFNVAVAFSIIGGIAVCMRFYVRGRMTRNIGWDDWAMLASMVGDPIVAGRD